MNRQEIMYGDIPSFVLFMDNLPSQLLRSLRRYLSILESSQSRGISTLRAWDPAASRDRHPGLLKELTTTAAVVASMPFHHPYPAALAKLPTEALRRYYKGLLHFHRLIDGKEYQLENSPGSSSIINTTSIGSNEENHAQDNSAGDYMLDGQRISTFGISMRQPMLNTAICRHHVRIAEAAGAKKAETSSSESRQVTEWQYP